MHCLVRTFPNERSHLILEFPGPEYRIFDVMTLYKERGWKDLAYPQHLKNFVASEAEIYWPSSGTVDSDFLYERSVPIDAGRLEHEVIRLSYKNQAPTPEDMNHHVYGVYLAPLSTKPFRVGESIGGGMADRGGGYDFSLEELLVWPDWKKHFALSGCSWAITFVESLAAQSATLIEDLVKEACQRNGLPEGQ